MINNPIKVLFLIHRINVGGAEQRLSDFLKYEKNNESFSFEVLCLREKGVLGEEISRLGIVVSVLEGRNRIHKLLKLISFLRDKKPDIIHLHLWPTRLYTIIIKLFSSASLIYTVENQCDKITKSERILERLFYILTDKIIAVSNSVMLTYCKKVKVRKDKIGIIYNGVNISRLSFLNNKCFKKELELSDQNTIITTIGRLVDFKGHIYLVRAAKVLEKKYPYLKFVIVGDGDCKENIIKEIKKLELEDMFILTGNRRDIGNILNSTDIFVLSSVSHEGHPIALVEAMMSGKAVVTTNIEGIGEVVNNNNGIVVPSKDYMALAKGIEELIINKEKRLQLGKEAKKYIQSKFTIESMCNSYEKLYCKVIKKQLANNKILYVEKSSGFGGSINSLINMISYLDQKKFYPIAALKNYGSRIEKIKNIKIIKLKDYNESQRSSNLNFIFFFIKNIIPESIKIYFILKREKVSLLHINSNIILGIPAILSAKVAGIPCVSHIRQSRKLIKRERIFSKYVDKFIVLNKNAYEIYKQDIPEEKLNIIYNGIDLEEFSEFETGKLRREFNLDGLPIVGLVARIVRGKGQKEFILAAKEVLKIKPNVKFIIIGDTIGYADGYYKEVKELAREENLDKSIIFTGWRNDVKNIIADLDISVLASTTFPEGLPNTVIEAMAMAKPVVATNVPGPSDIVVDGLTGYLVPPGDTKAMAEKIIYFLDNRNIAETMGERGRERVEKLFNIKKQVGEIEKVYEELLS